jgi:putative salt-induced outer membrane protein YdiY
VESPHFYFKTNDTENMKQKLLTIGAILTLTFPTMADVVITHDGARLTGQISLIDAGLIHLETAYAGMLEIKQEEVASFETDEPVFVRLASGTTMSGPVQSSGNGTLKIQSEDGTLETDMTRVAASWSPMEEDPQIVQLRAKEEALRRQWKFRGGIDMLGKSGNSEELSLGLNFKAKLKSPNDELAFYSEYEEREKNGEKTEDRLAGGISYESFFSEHLGWYVRTQLETDAIDRIDLRSTNGAGLSYRLINKEHQKLVARSGLGYRYTAYEDGKENESSPTLDFGLAHSYRLNRIFSMENDLSYVPSTDDFGQYRVVHDSGIEIPVGSGDNWKIRLGIKNEYESQPAAEKNLDSTYYTRMIYSWD